MNSCAGGSGSPGSSSSETDTVAEHSPDTLRAVVHVPSTVTADSSPPMIASEIVVVAVLEDSGLQSPLILAPRLLEPDDDADGVQSPLMPRAILGNPDAETSEAHEALALNAILGVADDEEDESHELLWRSPICGVEDEDAAGAHSPVILSARL